MVLDWSQSSSFECALSSALFGTTYARTLSRRLLAVSAVRSGTPHPYTHKSDTLLSVRYSSSRLPPD